MSTQLHLIPILHSENEQSTINRTCHVEAVRSQKLNSNPDVPADETLDGQTLVSSEEFLCSKTTHLNSLQQKEHPIMKKEMRPLIHGSELLSCLSQLCILSQHIVNDLKDDRDGNLHRELRFNCKINSIILCPTLPSAHNTHNYPLALSSIQHARWPNWSLIYCATLISDCHPPISARIC